MKLVLIPLSSVKKIKWQKKDGEKLRSLRGATPRSRIASKTGLKDQYIKDIEDGRYSMIDPKTLALICQSLNANISEFVSTYIFELSLEDSNKMFDKIK
jgi:transcriptional regulator with XRE-family HTH domain